MDLELLDSRRLTGPNLFGRTAGAIIDVAIAGIDQASVITGWRHQVESFLDAVGWSGESVRSRRFDGGASLMISAPIDALYAATEVNEAAWQATCAQLGQGRMPDFRSAAERLRNLIAAESNPRLRAIATQAEARGVRFLWDDDEVSVGYGPAASVWPMTALPEPEAIDWPEETPIPLALITGTNGKSTSVRLLASVVEAAGLTPGLTSTDFIRVGDTIIDTGDYSGPGGARTLLRHPDVELAILEVARGGILRRGLGVGAADAALITNVAADHLGDYGINSVPELIETKFVVRQALSGDAPLILNADDAGIVRFASRIDNSIIWFSESEQNPVLGPHRDAGGTSVFLRDEVIWLRTTEARPLVPVADIPVTLGGAARHNVQNCLAVAALAHGLGLPDQAIADGLKAFVGDRHSNPGRGNFFEVGGTRIIVDFAHNEHGLEAVAGTLQNLPANRRLVLLCQAGDRRDEEIASLTRAACRIKPDRVIACEISDYLRGRSPGEVPGLICKTLKDLGIPESAISEAGSVTEGTRQALDWAEPGDLLLLLALAEREQVFALIDEAAKAGEPA